MIIPLYNPLLLFIKPWTLNMWFAGRSLCLQWHFYLWGIFFRTRIRKFTKCLVEIHRWTLNALKIPSKFGSLNPHIILCTQSFQKCKAVAAALSQMSQQLGCVWPLPQLDKLWEEESSSGDASVERRVSILSWYKDSFRFSVRDIASQLLFTFLKALSCSTYTHFRNVNLTFVLNCFRQMGGIVP